MISVFLHYLIHIDKVFYITNNDYFQLESWFNTSYLLNEILKLLDQMFSDIRDSPKLFNEIIFWIIIGVSFQKLKIIYNTNVFFWINWMIENEISNCIFICKGLNDNK